MKSKRRVPSHGTSPLDVLSPSFAFWAAIATLPSSTGDPDGSPADRHKAAAAGAGVKLLRDVG